MPATREACQPVSRTNTPHQRPTAGPRPDGPIGRMRNRACTRIRSQAAPLPSTADGELNGCRHSNPHSKRRGVNNSSVHKDHCPETVEDDVWSARQIPSVKAVSVPAFGVARIAARAQAECPNRGFWTCTSYVASGSRSRAGTFASGSWPQGGGRSCTMGSSPRHQPSRRAGGGITVCVTELTQIYESLGRLKEVPAKWLDQLGAAKIRMPRRRYHRVRGLD